jgi:CheY-like chemotaxis protein
MPQQPRRVLVAEDDDDLRSAVVKLLEIHGYSVAEAAGGAETLAMARAGEVDLVLLDLGLPGINGLDVARELRQDARTAGIPIVAITGSWIANVDEALHAAGFSAGLRKPFSAAYPAATVAALLPAAPIAPDAPPMAGAAGP